MSSVLTTDRLLKTIKRRGFIPNSQESFTDADFLEIATEEMNFGIIPMMIRAQEEHLVYTIDIPFELGKRNYAIPTRAHGNKVRDVSLIDTNGNIYEMFRYSIDEIPDFSKSNFRTESRGFYIQNNEIILLGEGQLSYKALRFYIYLRPNALVPFDNGGVSTSLTSIFETDNLNPYSQVATNIAIGVDSIITLPTTEGLTSGDFVLITSSNSTPSIDGLRSVTVLSSTQIKVEGVNVTVAGTSANVTKQLECVSFSLAKFPKNFAIGSLYDFTQKDSPNKIIHWDVPVNTINFNAKQISFPKSLISKVQLGDFITLAEESIVPNIPVELHPILAQRVAIACLESMGDEQGKQSAERKLKEMETSVMTLIDNRVEAANVKIKNRHGVLQQATRSRLKRYSR